MRGDAPRNARGLGRGRFLFSGATAAALLLLVGCGGRPATAPPQPAPSAPAAVRVAQLRVVWGAEPDQERYRLGVEAAVRAALVNAGWRLDAEEGGSWTLRLDRVAIDTPFENFGAPAPGQSRTPMVRVRPAATIEAKLLPPAGEAREATGIWQGVFNTAEPEAYHDLAFERAAERVAERVTAAMDRATRAR